MADTRYSDDEISDLFGTYVPKPAPVAAAIPEDTRGDFRRGLGNYPGQIKSMAGTGVALAGEAIERTAGKGAIGTGLKEYGTGLMQRAEQAQVHKPTDSFTGAWGQGGGAVLTDWLPYQVGQGVGNIAEMAATAGAGALAGSAVAPGAGTITGAIGGALMRKGTKELLAKEAQRILVEKGAEAATKYTARQVGKSLGVKAGLAGAAAFHGVGETGQRAIEEHGLEGVNFGTLVPAAVGHAGLELAGDVIMARALGFGKAKDLTRPDIRRGALPFAGQVSKGALVTGTKEAPVEIGQTALERFGAELGVTAEGSGREYIDAMAAAYGMSALPGGVGGARRYIDGQKKVEPTTEQEQPPTPGVTPTAPSSTVVPTTPPKKVSAKQRLEDLWAQSAPEDTPDFPAVSELNDDLAKTARRAAILLEKSPKEGVAGQKALAEFTKTRDTIYAAHKNEMALKPAQEAFLAEGGSKGRWAQLKKLSAEEFPAKLLDLASDIGSKASTPNSAYLAAYAAHQGVTLEEAQNAVQERSAAQEVPRTGTAGQVVTKGGEGVGQGVEGQEVAAEGKAEEVIPQPPVDSTQLSEFESDAHAYLTKGMDPVEMALYESTRATESKGKTSLRALAKNFGVSHTEVATRAKRTEMKLHARAKALGISMSEAERILGMEQEKAVDTAVGVAAFEGGRRSSAQAESDDFVETHGFSRDEDSVETATADKVAAGMTEEQAHDDVMAEIDRAATLLDTQVYDAAESALALYDPEIVDSTARAWGEGFSDLPVWRQANIVGNVVEAGKTSTSAEDFAERVSTIIGGKNGPAVGSETVPTDTNVAEGTPAESTDSGARAPSVDVVAGNKGIGTTKVEVKKRRVVAKPEEAPTKLKEQKTGLTAAEDNRYFELDEKEDRTSAEQAEYDELKDRRESAPWAFPKLSETAGAENPISAETLTSRLKEMFRAAPLFDKLVKIYATQEEANAEGALSSAKGRVQGFKTADGKVGLIAENIEDGQELGVFLHEVGVHLGMEKLIGKANMKWLDSKILEWALKNDGSQESLAAKAAVRRARGSTTDNNAEGRIAYMVEELVSRGMNPQAVGSSPSSVWFRRLWAAAKVALRKIGFKRADFSGQNLVDLAYGAAHIELEGTWHGTAANFRKFHHAYMGSGEGAQAYGWGTYLAQREGIGRDYMNQDVRRKGSTSVIIFRSQAGVELRRIPVGGWSLSDIAAAIDQAFEEDGEIGELVDVGGKKIEGSLMRVASNVREDEFLDWDKPLSEQSEKVKDAFKEWRSGRIEAVRAALVGFTTSTQMPKLLATTNSDLDGMTGGEKYGLLTKELGSKEAASKYLDSIGIKGIKFLDATSRSEGEGTRNLVIFNDKNIVRAVTYQGGKKESPQFSEKETKRLDPVNYKSFQAMGRAEAFIKKQGLYKTVSKAKMEDGTYDVVRIKLEPKEGTKFSEAAPRATVAQDSPSKGVWEKAGAAFDRFFNDPMTMVKEHGLGWLSMDHLVEVAQGVNDKLSEYRDVSRKMQALSKEWVYKAAKIDSEWGALKGDDPKNLSAVMRAATRAGFDPETSAVPDTAAEHKIKTMYAKLSPAAVKVYKAARDHYASARLARQEIAGGVLTAAHKNLIATAEASGDAVKIKKAKDKLKDQLAKLDAKYKEVKGPYFPLMRLGKWYVVGMSKELAALEDIDNPSKADQAKISAMRKVEKHYTTSSYETKSQAEAAQKALSKRYGATRLNRAEEKSHAAGVLSAAGLQDVEDYINSSFDKDVASEIRTMMAELYYEALPEHHALKHEMKREGVHGEEEDMRRVFAVSTIKSAHYMSRLKHADELRGALFAIRSEGKKSSDSMEYYNEVVKRAKLSMDETSAPWADKIAAVSYLAHLGINPAFVLTNASQVAMITAPWLAARTSVGKTTAALGSAYRVAGDLIMSSYKKQGWRAELDWEGKVPKGVGDMLTTLLKRNLLDITIEHDLGATAELKNHALGDALKIGNLPVHITELANRTVTAIAAYDLAINELKMGQAEAEEFASKAVSTTQLDYSALNAPRHMQRVFGSAPAARIVMQFRKYQQGMLWLIGRSIYNALKSASPKEKAEAKKTLVGLFTTTGIMAGSLGMPLAGTAMWGATMVASLFGDDDEPWDARTEYLNWLTEVVGKDAAIAIVKGVPAWMLGIDLEKRVGLGDIASPLPFMRQGKTAQESAANALLAAAGAPVGTMVDVWDGIGMMGNGDWWKGAEKIVPLKGIQNLSRGARYGIEGMTERDGDTILPPDAFSIADIGSKMLGFATTKESVYYEATSAVKGAQQAAMDARKKLLAEFAQTRMANESSADVMEQVREFNKRHPEKGVRINASSLASALKSRRLAERQRGESGLLKSKQVKPFLKEAAFAE